MAEVKTIDGQEKVLLRTSLLGGFNKEEVLEYIDQLRNKNLSMTKELDVKMEEIAFVRNEFSQQISGFQSKLISMEEEIETKGNKIKDLTSMIDNMRNETARQRQSQIETEKKLLATVDENKTLQLKMEGYQYKANRYDDIVNQTTEIITEAKSRAKNTLDTANQKAQDIVHTAQTDAELMLSKAKADAELIDEIAMETSKRVTREVNTMRGEVQALRGQVESLMGSFSQRLDEIDDLLTAVMPSITNHEGDSHFSEQSVSRTLDSVKMPCPNLDVQEKLNQLLSESDIVEENFF